MPALRELELHGLERMSSDAERDLFVAPQPALTSLTSLSVSCETKSHDAARALYLWLRWMVPAAPQLRKLTVYGSGDPYEGVLPFHVCGYEAPMCGTARLVVAVRLPSLHSAVSMLAKCCLPIDSLSDYVATTTCQLSRCCMQDPTPAATPS